VQNNNGEAHTDAATGCSSNETPGIFYALLRKNGGCLSQTFGGSSEDSTLLFCDAGNGSRSFTLPKSKTTM
jgi:hypothetical protein